MGLTPLIQNELSSGNEKFFQSLIERTFLVYKINFMSKLNSIKGLTPLFQNELRSEKKSPSFRWGFPFIRDLDWILQATSSKAPL
jgi:hypothetical protein